MSEDTQRDRGLFSPAVIGFLVASVVAIFALSVLLASMNGQETPIGATLTSPSAIGHKGFYTLLQRLDFPVVRSRLNDTISARRGGLLVIDEPDEKLMSNADGSAIADAPATLLILPKWTGERDILREGWISKAKLVGLDVPQKILRMIDSSAGLIRIPAPAAFARNSVGVAPKLDGETQLIESKTLTPILANGDKLLVAEYASDAQRIWILADPDPTENHGIAEPQNTRFVLALIRGLRHGRGQIVFDETVHGAVAPERNPIQLLFQFPFVVVTAQIIAALGLLLLATTARFGGAEEPPPPFALGKARLIDNIAALMDRAGHQANILRRYVSVKLAETGRALHAPAGLDDNALAAWLDRIGAQRGVVLKASTIIADAVSPRGRHATILSRLFDEARDIHRWNKDMLDGSRRRQDHR